MALIKCKDCDKEISDQAKSCLNCGAPVVNFIDLSPYYQEEFKKIAESNGDYTGKWNWAAFFFGGFWALTKGLWLSALVCLIAGIFTGGIGFIVYWFIYGARGNYMRYSLQAKKEQLIV